MVIVKKNGGDGFEDDFSFFFIFSWFQCTPLKYTPLSSLEKGQ